MLQKSPPNHDGRPNHAGGTLLASEPRGVSSSVKPMSARKLVADKLLWETLERWKRSSPELDRIQFLKTVLFLERWLYSMKRRAQPMPVPSSGRTRWHFTEMT